MRELGIRNVTAAASGKAALRVLLDYKRPFPDLIITDLLMDGMDGHQLCKSIRSTAGIRNQDVPIIMLTAADNSRLKGIPGSDQALFVAKKPIVAGSLKQLLLEHTDNDACQCVD